MYKLILELVKKGRHAMHYTSDMFADAAVDDLYAIIRKMSISTARRVKGNSKIMKMKEDRMNAALFRSKDLY